LVFIIQTSLTGLLLCNPSLQLGGGLYQWYDATGITGTPWLDKSGNGLTGSISGTVNRSTDTAGSNGNTVGISYYTGNTGAGVTFGVSIP
jgi:hypothetical protein